MDTGVVVERAAHPAIADQLAELGEVRTVRSGGYPWPARSAARVLVDHGYRDVREIERVWQAPIRLIVGRR